MKSTIIFAAVVATSITPAMAYSSLYESIRQDDLERRIEKQEQQLRGLQHEQRWERWGNRQKRFREESF